MNFPSQSQSDGVWPASKSPRLISALTIIGQEPPTSESPALVLCESVNSECDGRQLGIAFDAIPFGVSFRTLPALSKSDCATYIGDAGRKIGYGDKRLSE